MDRYTEDFNRDKDFYYLEMIKHKEICLKKLRFISSDMDVQEKFAKMIIEAECEGCIYADDFIAYFDIEDIDKMAILEDLECFIEEYKETIEGNRDYE